MKNLSLNFRKQLGILTLASLLFAAQTTQGQWVVQPAMPIKAMEVKAPIFHPAALPVMAISAVLPKAESVASKEIWVGDSQGIYHISAREILTTVDRPAFQISPKAYWKSFHPVFLRIALLAITQEQISKPLTHSFSGARRIQHSA